MLELPSARRTSQLISIAVFSCWFGFVPAQAQDKTVDAIAQVESGLLSPIAIKGEATKRMTLHERMTRYKVPAVSLAVIDGGRIVWSRSYGFVDDDGTPATPDTLFQAASISKPVTAAAALMFVARGALELDAPVNRYLSSWKVPESPRASADAVTLRRLLSHSAGISVHGFDGYEASGSAPTLQQILDGRPPAQSRPIRIEQAPATGWQYSGGGYTIIQQLLEDVGGKSFPRLMSESVLESAGMKTSTFLQPLNGEFAGRAATGYQADGRPVAGRWHIYPELAAAGLWTTPSDLARFALWTMAEDSARPSVIPLLRERQPGLVTPYGGMGLGFFVGGEGEGRYFLHGGGNAGFRCYLIGFPVTGQGVAIMTNSDGGTSLALELARSVAAAYQWPDRQQRIVRARRIDRRTLARRAGVYHSGSTSVTISAVPAGLEARQDDNTAVILRAENDKTFVDPDSGTEYRFSRPTAEAGDTLLITPPRGNATTLRRQSIRPR